MLPPHTALRAVPGLEMWLPAAPRVGAGCPTPWPACPTGAMTPGRLLCLWPPLASARFRIMHGAALTSACLMSDHLVSAVADGHDVSMHECLLRYVRDGQTHFRVSYGTYGW